MYKITASIVTFRNDFETLGRAIKSFLNTELDVRLYVIDNSPTDKIRKICEDRRIEYVFNNRNTGFGAGHNIGIKLAFPNSRYHLILNPDVYFGEGVLEKLYDFSEANQGVGLVMPKVLYPDGKLQYLCKILPTPLDAVSRRFSPFRRLQEKRDSIYELRFTGYDKIMDVPYLSGCFMFIRTEVFFEAGGFDERFFLHYEDVDLSRRINRKYRTVFYPYVFIYHEHAREAYKNLRGLLVQMRSAVRYFNKWGWFFDRERTLINTKTLKALEQGQEGSLEIKNQK